MKKLITILLILLIATVSHADIYTVERVIDGDTIVVTTPEGKSEEVQLIGIDAPESEPNIKAKRDSKRTGQDLGAIIKMGQEATEFVKELELEGKEVRLEFDVQKRDKNGEMLAYVYFDYCRGAADCLSPTYYVFPFLYAKFKFPNEYIYDVLINATIIKAGYASQMSIVPNVKYTDLFKELYEEARKQKRGLWIEEPQEE